MKRILIPIIILILFIVLLILFIQFDKEPSNEKGLNIDSSENNLDEELAECNFNSTDPLPCFERLSLDKDDITLCNNLENPDERESCKSNFARVKNDESYCNLIEENFYKNSCYWWIAYDKRNPSICSNIVDAELKNSCIKAANS